MNKTVIQSLIASLAQIWKTVDDRERWYNAIDDSAQLAKMCRIKCLICELYDAIKESEDI